MFNLNKLSDRAIFYIFLCFHFIIWTIVSLFRHILYVDASEAIIWGQLFDFGTNKHPPLSGWLANGFYTLFGQNDFGVYVLGQLCILIGLIFTYKIARQFLSRQQAICSVILLEACYYYTYMVYVNIFNCNIMLIPFWSALIYYFYRCIDGNKLSDWAIFGLIAGFASLAKYQTVFLFFAMLVYLLVTKIGREQFKRFGLYLAFLIGLIVIAPHIYWLSNTDFFSFVYMVGRTHMEDTHHLPMILIKLGHIFFPVKFYLNQIIAVLACLVIYFICYFKNKEKFVWAFDYKKAFILILGLLPVIAQGAMGFVSGSRIPTVWGSVMVCMVGIMLFVIFPIKFNEKIFQYFIKFGYAAMLVTASVSIIYYYLQTDRIFSLPYEKIFPAINQHWHSEFGDKPVKYVIGSDRYAFSARFYNSEKPQVILDTAGHKNIWVDYDDIKSSGVLVIEEDSEDLKPYAMALLPYLTEEYEITPHKYDYQICNVLKMCEKYEFYYAFIEPME